MANQAVQMNPELLKAAKRGDWRKLGDLMSQEGAFVIDIEEEHGEPPVRSTHTYAPDSILLAVASGGDDGDKFLKSATVICDKAKHLLLSTCNAKGDTPFHCAARGGSVKMLSHLINLARRDGGDDAGSGGGNDGGGGEVDGGRASRLQLALRKQNDRGETALHEAIRWGDEEMVDVLMSADPGLAGFPRNDGTSPLYLAILLGHDDIAEQLYEKDSQLSLSGPDGQNALHVAVLRSARMTRELLARNKNLTKQGDRSSGRTPLHYAASWGIYNRRSEMTREVLQVPGRAKLILEADESSAYQSDNNGLFPIHVAALENNVDVVHILLRKCPDCAQLRDGQGRTFLHVTVKNDLSPRKHLFPSDAYHGRRLAAILNAQDLEGNTALHLAVTAGWAETVRLLLLDRKVQLNLQNNKGQTALDLSVRKMPSGLSYGWDPTERIHRMLHFCGARFGIQQGGKKEHAPALKVKEEAEMIRDSATTVGVVSVLILTVSFAAAFQLPGGYSTGNKPEGTPELANKYSFQAFVVANNLALFSSGMATISLMYAGVSNFHIHTRILAFATSIFFLNSAARSILAAFAFGTYAVLASVSRAAAVLTLLSSAFLLIDIALYTSIRCLDYLLLINRMGIRACLRFVAVIVKLPMEALWPYVVIAGFMAHVKTHGIH